MRPLTTTSYAILGLLTLRPWSAYELTRQMERSLGRFWPRAASKLYEEPKTLVAHGYATADRQGMGRKRTVYTITTAGRAAFRRWLDTPGAAPALEFEGLVKVFFAEQGTHEQLLATLRAIHAHGAAVLAIGEALTREAAAGKGPFPARLHVNALVNRYLMAFISGYTAWAAWAIDEVARWPDVTASPETLAGGRAIMRETVQLLEQATMRAEEHFPSP